MKKIGILTFHRSINYGAYMQCLSLSHYLQTQFPDCKVEVIDYESKIMHDIYVPKIHLYHLKHPKLYFLTKAKYKKFQIALKHLPLSDKYFIFDGENQQLQNYITQNYDAVIVGSDAVWNWIKRGFPNPYLLNIQGIPKLSYAASAYGMGMEYVGEKEKEYFKKCLEDYSFIGVRDEYTASLVESVCPQQNPSFTCDPTVFLDLDYVLKLLGHTKESYKEYIMNKFNLPKDKKLIGIMETTDTAAIKAIKQKCKDEYYTVCVYNYINSADKYIADVDPLEWSLLFSLFEFTVTNYFHGTLLSLKNNTPVISFDRTAFSKNNEGKIHDVMRRMELLDCFFDDTASVDDVLRQVDLIIKNKADFKEKIKNNIEILAKSNVDFINSLRKLV